MGLSSSFPAWHVWQNAGAWQEEHRLCPWRAYAPWELMNTREWRNVPYGFNAPEETFSWHSRQLARPAARSSGCFGGTDGAFETAGYPLLAALQLSGNLTYTQSPIFEKDYAGLVRLSYDLGTGTGGKK